MCWAAALHAQRIGRAGRVGHRYIERRQIARARHAIIHVAGGEQLSGVIVGRAFQQRLTNALGDPAMHLAFDDHRVDQVSKVIHRSPAFNSGGSCLRIDLHFGDMDASGKGEICRIVKRAFLQPRLNLGSVELVGDVGLQRYFAEFHGPVCAAR